MSVYIFEEIITLAPDFYTRSEFYEFGYVYIYFDKFRHIFFARCQLSITFRAILLRFEVCFYPVGMGIGIESLELY